MTAWQSYLDEHQARFQDELLDFLRIPSVSALPEHAGDVRQAGEWVAARLQAAGMENVAVLPTAGHPVVYGDWLHAPGQPTILIYGHFDVQPVDPLPLWSHPPFEPFVEGDRVYARGASDDKGNMFVPILAIEALLKSTGKLPVNVKFFLEGQEEIGSPQIPDFLAADRDRFACDLVISADGTQWSETEPSLTLGLKGVCGLQIDVAGANRDLHSGFHGGVVQNPLHALVHILDSMHGLDGTVAVDGFYDQIVPLTEADRALIAATPYDDAAYKASVGVDEFCGEPGYTVLERRGARPTLEINGMWGGFQGEGSKTIIPNEAHAKITCRLVPDQDPEQVADLIIAHIEQHTLPGVKVNAYLTPGIAHPYLMPVDHPGNQAAEAVLKALYDRPPYYIRVGGSVPVCALFLKELRAYTITFGFGLEDEYIHAPNEFFRFSSFQRGQTGYCMLLERLGEVAGEL